MLKLVSYLCETPGSLFAHTNLLHHGGAAWIAQKVTALRRIPFIFSHWSAELIAGKESLAPFHGVSHGCKTISFCHSCVNLNFWEVTVFHFVHASFPLERSSPHCMNMLWWNASFREFLPFAGDGQQLAVFQAVWPRRLARIASSIRRPRKNPLDFKGVRWVIQAVQRL